MSIFRRTGPRPEPRIPAPPLSAFWSGNVRRVTPLDNTRPVLSPDPGLPERSMSGPVRPEFDPCGAPPLKRTGGKP
jgi:hypothetical protein